MLGIMLFVSIGAALFGAVRGTIPSQKAFEENKRLADEAWSQAARGDNISAGKEIDSVVAVAESLRDEGKDEEACEYFRRATIIAPMRVDFRFSYARLCVKTGKTEDATRAYKLVLTQAESDEMLDECGAFLDVAAYPALPAFASVRNRSGDKDIRLCLITVPGSQQWLAHDVGVRLRQLLNIEVYIEQRDFVPAQPDRGGVSAYVSELRGKLPWQDIRFAALATQLGVADAESAADWQILEVAREYMRKYESESAVEQFDKAIKDIERHNSQWQSGMLITRLRLSAMPQAGPRTLYVVLIPQDLYEANNNFMFGAAEMNGEYGVVSYHRFAAEFTGETAKRERLVTRTYKQMLSSIGFMLGVQRNTDPICARAYPASLAEHDAKSDKLCDECRSGFEKALGHELGIQ